VGAEGLLLLFLFVSLRLAKSNAFSAAVIVDEFNAGGLQRSAQRGFIRERCWDFPIDDLWSSDIFCQAFANARSTARGSRSMMVRYARAVMSGVDRPCS
jgi:hypothetical protein